MGDRTGLGKVDRTNGYEDSRNYMKVKQTKLANQNDQIREALRQRNSTMRSEIFKGISITVNGRTQPTADELKRLILLNGGDYHPYYRYQTTKFMIATNLSMARIKQLRPDDRIVRPDWITDSIQVQCLLPYEDYQLYDEETRGKNGSVLAIEHDQGTSHSMSSDDHKLVSVAESYSKNYRGKSRHSRGNDNPVTKCRDIREMFGPATRVSSRNDDQKPSSRQETSRDGSEVISIHDSPPKGHSNTFNTENIETTLSIILDQLADMNQQMQVMSEKIDALHADKTTNGASKSDSSNAICRACQSMMDDAITDD